MKRTLTTCLLSGMILAASSCASIFSKSSYPISINSTPMGAKISITDKKGTEIYTGKTPANIKLKASNGYFSRARYIVKFDQPGYATKTVPVEYKLDGWYFGNILIGGLVGMLIIDPATGAMYKLETEFLNETLERNTANLEQEELKVFTMDEVPGKWRSHMEALEN
ncbi:hypothetical protein [Echinicola sp. 20G]|uniref:hypothetical protein n=1 Tax=Echinicola sp. 20G TaxID=2781961 RepID=UPI0019109FEE|nr:hypothetical protein [Echinicola sp. 20G]